MKDENTKKFILYQLLSIVNSSEVESNDTIIARAFIENREKLDTLSLDMIARQYYVSQASISRFITKCGFRSFNEFRSYMKLSAYMVEQRNVSIGKNAEEVRHEVYCEIKEALEDMMNLKLTDILHVKNMLESYHRIVMIGSELSMSLFLLMQNKLIAQGHDVYTFHKVSFQNELIPSLCEDDLLLAVSIADRWLSMMDLNVIREAHAKTLLLTIDTKSDYRDCFDEVFVFGKWINSNVGYHQLMQLEQILYRIL